MADDGSSDSGPNWGGAAAGAASGAAMGSALGPWGTAIGAVAGGLIGLLSSASARGASDAELQQIVNDYQNLPLPVQQQITAQQLGGTAMDAVAADPATRAAQYAALTRLQQTAQQGGLTLGDRANLALANDEAARQGMAQRQSIQNEMDARGVGNSGASYAMQMGAAQAAGNQANQNGLQMVANASRNSLQALQQAGTLGGQMEAQQFSEAAQKAKARDMMAEYNANARNSANVYNAGLAQKQYEDALQRMQGLGGALQGQAQANTANANRTQSTWANVGAGLGQVAGASLGRNPQQQPMQSQPDPGGESSAFNWQQPSPLASNNANPDPFGFLRPQPSSTPYAGY